MSAHAKLSPSSAYRWFVCSGSVRETAGMPDNSSVYAREGTAAHSLAERCLKSGTAARAWLGEPIEVPFAGSDGSEHTDIFAVTVNMAEAVQVYLDLCRELGSQPGATVLVEEQVGLGAIDPVLEPVWGTSDCTIYTPHDFTLYTIDYKHGAGVVVSVDDNKQTKIYGLAAWATFHAKFKVKRIVTIIVQPRAGGEPIRRAEYDAATLLDFAQDVVEAVQRTEAPDAPLVPGSHCEFCKLNGQCRAQASKAMEVAKDEFALTPPQQLTIDQCVAILDKAETFEEWIKGVRQFLHEAAERGENVPGYKLVPKRATRKWAVPEKEVVASLAPLVASDDELFSKELLSPAQMEKVVGKKNLPADLIASVSSGYNLVKDTDNRPAVTLHPGDDFIALPSP